MTETASEDYGLTLKGKTAAYAVVTFSVYGLLSMSDSLGPPYLSDLETLAWAVAFVVTGTLGLKYDWRSR